MSKPTASMPSATVIRTANVPSRRGKSDRTGTVNVLPRYRSRAGRCALIVFCDSFPVCRGWTVTSAKNCSSFWPASLYDTLADPG